MVAGKQHDTKLSEEEKKIRQEEDELFKKLKAPPSKLEGVSDILGDDQCSESLTEQRITDKKRLREKDEKRSAAFKKVAKYE
jgi:hypothetical protein